MAYTFTTELKHITSKYAKLINAKVASHILEKDIEEHPNYPSLLALSDVYSRYNIENVAHKISNQDFSQLAFNEPFIAFTYVENIGNDFVLVRKFDGRTVSYTHRGRKIETISKDDFLLNFRNIVWKAQPDHLSGDSNYIESIRDEGKRRIKKYSSLAVLVSIFLVLIYSNITPQNIASYINVSSV